MTESFLNSYEKRNRSYIMIKILIVEDEEPIANLIRMNLVKAGYQCEIASDGELAADAIRSGHLILFCWISCFRS